MDPCYVDVADTRVWLEVRPSQTKWNDPVSPAYYFEIVNVSRAAPSAFLGEQMARTLLLSQRDRNVRLSIYDRLLELLKSVEKSVTHALWDVVQSGSGPELRREIETLCRIFHQRNGGTVKRPGIHRTYEEDDAELLEAEKEASIDPRTGRPVSAAERAVEMLDKAYSCDSPELISCLGQVAKSTISDSHGQFRIPIPNSRCLYAMVDPFAILSEGEVFCSLSNVILDCVSRRSTLNPIAGQHYRSRYWTSDRQRSRGPATTRKKPLYPVW